MTSLIVLRLIHILGGIFWVGAMLYNTFFLMPILAGIGPAAGPVIAGLQRRRLMTILPIVALLTILSGLGMMSIVSDGNIAAYVRTGPGRILSSTGGLAIIALVLGFFVVRPAMMGAAQLGQRIAQAPEGPARQEMSMRLAAIRSRSAAMSMVVTWLLIFAAAGMAVARYL